MKYILTKDQNDILRRYNINPDAFTSNHDLLDRISLEFVDFFDENDNPTKESDELESLYFEISLLMDRALDLCRCCGKPTIEEYDSFEICEICLWEDDNLQYAEPDREGGANKMSLNQAKEDARRRGLL